MRVAIVSDIHGNRTAFDAVLADLRETAPDLVLHGGDLASSGSSPAEIIDQIRNLGWRGVMGNTDEMLVRADALEAFASQSSAPAALWEAVREIAAATRVALGAERLAWLSDLPAVHAPSSFALVHASPNDMWRVPGADTPEPELERVYGVLDRRIVIHGHTHVASIRGLAGGRLLIDTGSVGLPYDGDCRASYLLLENEVPSIRRVEYNVDREVEALSSSALPHATWIGRMLRAASPQLP
jgi:predicted phosphodiesterase